MRIQNISSAQSFGKTPVMYCKIKRADNREKTRATLYKLDIFDHRDITYAKYSNTSLRFLHDMINDKRNSQPKDYFLMTDDKTGDVISCAETSNHLRVSNDKISGKYLLINEYNQSGNYIRPDVPMFAFFAQKAASGGNGNIAIGTPNIEESTLKKDGFLQAQNTEWYMPHTRYSGIIALAKKFNFVG